MTKIITTFRNDLRIMEIGGELKYAEKLHKGYMATASALKSAGEGEWNCAKRRKVLKDENGDEFECIYWSAIRKS